MEKPEQLPNECQCEKSVSLSIPHIKKMTQAERFIEGLRLLSEECGVTAVEYNAYGVTKFKFEDGSWAGSVRAYINAGYIKEENYDSHFGK